MSHLAGVRTTWTLSGSAVSGGSAAVQVDFVRDFEGSDGGFTHSGVTAPWAWGTPRTGPGIAYSGTKVWATNLVGSYPSCCSASLYTPRLLTAVGTHPVLELWDWYRSEWYYDRGRVQISSHEGVT